MSPERSNRRPSRGPGRTCAATDDEYGAINERIRASGAISVSFALVDHENYYDMRDLAPSLWTWGSDDPDSYLAEHANMIASIRRHNPGVKIEICWVAPAEYVEWCRSGGHEVDSVESWGAYGEPTGGGLSDVFYEDESLWAMSVRDMVFRSEAFAYGDGPLLDPARRGVDDVRGHLVAWSGAEAGDFRVVVTASRWSDCDVDAMWRHFRGALTSPAVMQHCGDFISVAERPLGAGDDHYGPLGREPVIQAFGDVVMLAGHAGGLVGVEHRRGGSRTLRAFGVSRGGVVAAVGVDDLGRRLGAPGSSLLASGWPT